MARTARKAILFLDAPPGDRARAAATEFDAITAKLGLAYGAVVRLLPIGNTSREAEREPLYEGCAAMIAMSKSECEPLLRPAELFGQHIEFWEIASDFSPTTIGAEVSKLVARLLGGRVVKDEPMTPPAVKEPPKKVHTVRVGRETAGRRGKGVTTVFDLPLTEDGMKELATTLKQKCGTGGTVKDGRIEIQGDHRDRIAAELEKLGYRVKRAGG